MILCLTKARLGQDSESRRHKVSHFLFQAVNSVNGTYITIAFVVTKTCNPNICCNWRMFACVDKRTYISRMELDYIPCCEGEPALQGK